MAWPELWTFALVSQAVATSAKRLHWSWVQRCAWAPGAGGDALLSKPAVLACASQSRCQHGSEIKELQMGAVYTLPISSNRVACIGLSCVKTVGDCMLCTASSYPEGRVLTSPVDDI